MLRSMNEAQTMDILANFWNNADGKTRLSLVRTLFDGYPPPRLTSTEELMKLNYPMKKLSAESSKFMEIFRNERSESEQLFDLEVNSWPKISLKNQQNIFNFLQLSSEEKVRIERYRRPIVEGNVFDANAIMITDQYFLPCDMGQKCDQETPSCILYQQKMLCVKQCIGDPNCFAFNDPYYKRAWPGKCIADQKVCKGYSYYDPQQDKGVVVPFSGAASGDGWSTNGITFPWSSATDSSVVQIFSLLLPILLLCINF